MNFSKDIEFSLFQFIVLGAQGVVSGNKCVQLSSFLVWLVVSLVT